MKKFIAAFDGLKFSESTLSYAILLAKHCNAHLVGVFLEDFSVHSYTAADMTSYQGTSFDEHMQDLTEKDDSSRDKSVGIFRQACLDAGLNFSVHRDKDIALQDLLHESIYADLLVINQTETFTTYEEPAPSRFLKDLLNDVQCPVVIVPPRYRPIDKTIMLYDGEPSSVFAVRSFGYLFEASKNFETEIITVKDSDGSLHLPDNKLMKEFIKRHHRKAEYIVLKGNAEDEIIKYLHHEKGSPLIVLGAYRRGRLSRLFRASMADHLLPLKMPLFIAHNKS